MIQIAPMLKYFFLSLALLFSAVGAIAGNDGHHDHSHDDTHEMPTHKAHLHGLAELTLALEGDSLEIRFESPAVNIVGFEHKAASAEQLQTVKGAKSVLESANRLFSFSGSNCSAEKAKADVSSLLVEDDHGHGSHRGTHKDALEDTNHSEITAHYDYQCTQGENLEAVTVHLIQHFPKIESLKVMWLTEKKQGAVELNARSNLISLK